MELAEGIRKHGFRKWHERKLLGSFAWLALVLLCGVAAFGALEALINGREWTDRAMSVLAITASGAIGIVALQRFQSGLVCAQAAASQAICKRCEVFGLLNVVAEGRARTWVRVQCRNCAHAWVMDPYARSK